jgi:hypothetical protein
MNRKSELQNKTPKTPIEPAPAKTRTSQKEKAKSTLYSFPLTLY